MSSPEKLCECHISTSFHVCENIGMEHLSVIGIDIAMDHAKKTFVEDIQLICMGIDE